jgi:sulfur carrier protein
VKVVLRQPRREVEVLDPPRRVSELLRRFDVVAESVLVIRGDELLTVEDALGPDDVIELRPVISGG